MKKHIMILAAALTLGASCGESLEDTYSKWAGDGEIRYLGMCTKLAAMPGWQRIIVKWENSVDPAIKQIKLAWALDGVRDSVMLDRGTTEYSIDRLNGAELADGNYEIAVSAVGEEQSSSIAATTIARPFTYSHEDIMTFNLMISRMFVVRNRLVLFFTPWNDNIVKATLSYTKLDGTTGTLELTKDFYNQMNTANKGLYWMLEDEVSPTGQFILNRRASLPLCNDVIDFEPHSFDTARRFDSDFAQTVESRYGYATVPSAWADTVRTVWLDQSIGTLANLLNLPSLTRLVLGGNRYQLAASVDDTTWGQSAVSDKAASDFTLKVLNQLTGLEVERYNKHYPTLAAAYLTEKGAPVPPAVSPYDLSGQRFTVTPASDVSDNVRFMTDGDDETYWEPSMLTSFATYELTLDMGAARALHGMCFVQRTFDSSSQPAIAYLPEYVIVSVSTDGVEWRAATYRTETRLGKSNGETNYIAFTDAVQAGSYRYVQLRINPILYSQFYRTTIADVRLY